jgi:hypothetical protein
VARLGKVTRLRELPADLGHPLFPIL